MNFPCRDAFSKSSRESEERIIEELQRSIVTATSNDIRTVNMPTNIEVNTYIDLTLSNLSLRSYEQVKLTYEALFVTAGIHYVLEFESKWFIM